MDLDPGRLLVLVTVGELGGVTRAARALGRTPPAVSQQLARLERDVGAQLVERHAQGVWLTPLGRRMSRHAKEIQLAVKRAAEDAADHLARHRDRLRLGAFPTAGLRLLPEALAALRHRRPDTELSVVDLGPHEGLDLVADRELDLALVAEYAEPLAAPTGVALVHLLDDPVHAVLPEEHPLAGDVGPSALSDFAADAWACAPPHLPNRTQLERAARAAGIEPTVPFEPESYAVAQALVSAGVAVSFVPELAITAHPGTRHRRLEPLLARRIHAAIPADTRFAPLTELFVELLRDVSTERR